MSQQPPYTPPPPQPPPPPPPFQPPGYPYYGGAYTVYARPVKPPAVFGRLDGLFALLAFVLGFFFVRYVFFFSGGVGVTVFTLLFAVYALAWMRAQHIRPAVGTYGYLAVMLLLGSYFLLFSNPMLQALATLVLIGMGAYLVAALSGHRMEQHLGDYALFDVCHALFITPFAHFLHAPQAAFRASPRHKGGRGLLFFLLGLLIAVPVIGTMAALLTRADAVFEHLWRQVLAFLGENIGLIFVQLLLAVPVGLYLFGLHYGCGPNGDRRADGVRRAEADANMKALRSIPTGLTLGVLLPLLLLYGVYFAAQMAYFTSAFAGLLPPGIDLHAEYARRGFFELCGICALNMLFILAVLLCNKPQEQRAPRAAAGVLAVFSLLFIACAFSKMALYIDVHGLTPKRIYTSVFMVWLAICFLLVLARLFTPKLSCMRWALIAAAVLFCGLCFTNTDAIIARQRMNAYRSGRTASIDMELMDRLGDAATPYLLELAEDGDSGIARQAQRSLRLRYESRATEWKQFSFSRRQSDLLVTEWAQKNPAAGMEEPSWVQAS